MARKRARNASPDRHGDIPVDPWRAFVFPNRLRDERRKRGLPKLLRLSEQIGDIPYIRLSKIERGEVFARAGELRRIAEVLGCDPRDLLIDIDAPDFAISAFAEPFMDGAPVSIDEERFAVALAAAVRVRRTGDKALTIAALDRDFGLPPVILSRIENAHKTLDRWNAATVDALCRLFGAADEAELRAEIWRQYDEGLLDPYVATIDLPENRLARTRERMAALAAELAQHPIEMGEPVAAIPETLPAPPVETPTPGAALRMLSIYGAPLPNGLIAGIPSQESIPAPGAVGPRAFGLRVFRPTLGGGLPGQAVVVVDPDLYPAPGGLAAIREGNNFRLVIVDVDRTGNLRGYSVNPKVEIDMDAIDPACIATIVAAIFV